MLILNKIKNFFKKIFRKNEDFIVTKSLPQLETQKNSFKSGLKFKNSSKVEVINCVGDGLGIDTKIES